MSKLLIATALLAIASSTAYADETDATCAKMQAAIPNLEHTLEVGSEYYAEKWPTNVADSNFDEIARLAGLRNNLFEIEKALIFATGGVNICRELGRL